MRFDPAPAPHLPASRRVSDVMLPVAAALVPAALVHGWYFGPGLFLNLIVAIAAALGGEAIALRAAAKPIRPFAGDGSALVTAVLIAFCVPPMTPAWVTAAGTLFAIVVAKHAYGGLGYNVFNPAMAGYAMLLIAFPAQMAGFPGPQGASGAVPGGADSVWRVFFAADLRTALAAVDAVTTATPLDTLKSGLGQMQMVSEITADGRREGIFSSLHGRGWDAVSLAYLAGGMWLWFRGIISWHAPAGVLASVLVLSAVFHGADADAHAGPLFHLLAPSTMLCTFFIVTDPVSGATSPRGRLVFGLGTGAMAFAIRTWAGYPDGIAFAVLLLNLLVPIIDRYTRPRVYGHAR
jgi:electron transport complex protein RnfD